MSTRKAKIVGTGLFVPPDCVTNEELARRTGMPVPKHIEGKLGIKQRYWTGPSLSSADLGTGAGQKAIEDAGLKVEDIDFIIACSDTPEYISPATSMVIQGRLGCVNAGVFDLAASCASFVSGCEVASRMIGYDETYKNILVIGIYNMTKFVGTDDPFSLPIFADGSGAAVLQATTEDAGYLASHLFADGTQFDYIGVYAGGTKYPMNDNRPYKRKFTTQWLESLKPLPGSRNVELWPPIVEKTLSKVNLTAKDMDWFIFTQINRDVIVKVMNVLGQPMDKAICVMDQFGYTGSGCIPMALDVARKDGRIKAGDNIIMVGSGSGLAVASVAFKM